MRYIVITSIFKPNEAVLAYSKIKGYKLIVVGDKKSPPDWHCDNVIYLSPEDQQKLGYKIVNQLPWNHYCRKMIGYLYAIEHGADMIFDTDDDNEPKPTWPAIPDTDKIRILSGKKFVNIYEHFTSKFVWPRGYPLNCILSKEKFQISHAVAKVGIWQFLADEDPDVDAIYRLTINEPIYFEDKSPVALAEGTVCPFNSQNTVFIKDLFPLLYLPAFVTFRFTDILRGLVAQPILWKHGYQLGFGTATVIQRRNPHDYLKDFESEIPVYLHAEKAIDLAKEALEKAPGGLSEQLSAVYDCLYAHSIVDENELNLLHAWLEDVNSLQKSIR